MVSTDKKNCRNCGSERVTTCDSGALAPFFMKRVLGLEAFTIGERVEELASHSSAGGFIRLAYLVSRKLPLAGRFFGYRSLAKTEVRVCAECGFVSPETKYSPEALSGLYLDYRSDAYNRDRCRFEPEYGKIQDLVGKSPHEQKLRLDNVDDLLNAHVDVARISTVLDWGGGEGRFVPRLLTEAAVDILDISDETPVNPKYRRIAQPQDGASYDFIQVCHVLEHVSEPLELLRHVAGYLGAGGVLYIEVPQDRSNEDLAKFRNLSQPVRHTVHEHLNLYSVDAVRAIGRAIGLQEIIVKRQVLDLGWTKSEIVSGLFTKR